MSRGDRAGAGFTLIEVMAVMLLTALVLGVALDFYVDLSNQSQRASEATRSLRRATSLLDRIALDFERTVLVKKPKDMDPLANPWLFLAEESKTEDGADRVKFVTRRSPDERTRAGVSDLAVVAYELRASPEGDGFQLLRWSQPGLPEALDRDFPPTDDPDALVLADGVASFTLRFLDDSDDWVSEWDSSQLLDSSELPVAVEIEVAMASHDPVTDETTAGPSYRRRVMLPVRPLDLETLTDPVAYAALGGQSGDQNQCKLTVADCVDLSQLGLSPGATGANPGRKGGTANPSALPKGLSALRGLSAANRQIVQQLNGANLGSMCWDLVKASYQNLPGVRPQCR